MSSEERLARLGLGLKKQNELLSILNERIDHQKKREKLWQMCYVWYCNAVQQEPDRAEELWQEAHRSYEKMIDELFNSAKDT
jgi:hypothetical protein